MVASRQQHHALAALHPVDLRHQGVDHLSVPLRAMGSEGGAVREGIDLVDEQDTGLLLAAPATVCRMLLSRSPW
jgi:hypothetical protein